MTIKVKRAVLIRAVIDLSRFIGVSREELMDEFVH